MIDQHIREWVIRLSTKQIALGGFSICPFSKNASYEIVHTDGSDIDPPPWDFDLIIYVLPDDYTEIELTEISKEYNKLLPSLVFLPDHRDRNTFINGIQTNNGKYNLILCQYRDNLQSAREKLADTSYYSFWDSDYLEEILNT